MNQSILFTGLNVDPNNSFTPNASVIVPVYNGESTIRECIESLLKQDYPSHCYEIIIVDNGSTDATLEIIAQYNTVKLLHQTVVQSSYATRNHGISQALGEIIAFTDADCIADSSWLSSLVKVFRNESVMVAAGQVLDVEATNFVEQFLVDVKLFHNEQADTNHFYAPILIGSTAFRRKVLEELGGFNANFYTGGDLDLGWRIQITYGQHCVRKIPCAMVYHKHRSTLKGLFRQYRRHGFGEIFLDAIYHRYPGYPHNFSNRVRQIGRQIWALVTYLRSFLYRLVKYPLQPDLYHLLQPLIWFVAESGNLWGKIQGLWVTRGLRLNPATRQWQDPGG